MKVTIEKSDRLSTPYSVLLNGQIIALCPSKTTANVVYESLLLKIEIRKKTIELLTDIGEVNR